MKFPIDAVFLDSRNTVVEIKYRLPANRVTGVYYRASSVLELPAGTLHATDTKVGDLIEIT
jgi:uncharacterized membrane protein (UPF0127 family)